MPDAQVLISPVHLTKKVKMKETCVSLFRQLLPFLLFAFPIQTFAQNEECESLANQFRSQLSSNSYLEAISNCTIRSAKRCNANTLINDINSLSEKINNDQSVTRQTKTELLYSLQHLNDAMHNYRLASERKDTDPAKAMRIYEYTMIKYGDPYSKDRFYEMIADTQFRYYSGKEQFLQPGEEATQVQFSEDGRYMVALIKTDNDSSLKLWDIKQAGTGGFPSGITFLSPAKVNIMALSPDGNWVIAGCQDKKIRLWKTSAPQTVKWERSLEVSSSKFAFSPDGKWVAVSNSLQKGYNSIYIIKIGETQQMNVITKIEQPISCIAFSPSNDGLSLLAGTERSFLETNRPNNDNRGKIIKWKLDKENMNPSSPNGEIIATGHTSGNINVLAFSPKKNILISGGGKQIFRWNWPLERQNSLNEIQLPGGNVSGISVIDERHFVSVGNDGASLWDINGTKLGDYYAKDALAVGKDDKFILTATKNGELTYWIRQHNPVIRPEFRTTAKKIEQVLYTDDMKYLVATTQTSFLVLDASTFKTLREIETQVSIKKILCVSKRSEVVCALSNGAVVRYNLDTGLELNRFQGPEPDSGKHYEPVSLAVSTQGNLLAVGYYLHYGQSGIIREFDLNTGQQIKSRIQGFKGQIACLSYLDGNDSHVLFAGCKDLRFILIGKETAWSIVPDSPGATWDFINLSPGNKYLYFFKSGKKEILYTDQKDFVDRTVDHMRRSGVPLNYDAWEGSILKPSRVSHNDANVKTAAMSRDASLLAAGFEDHTAAIWDVASDRKLISFGTPAINIPSPSQGRPLERGTREDIERARSQPGQPSAPTTSGYLYISAVTFAPDNSRLITLNSAGELKVWCLTPDCIGIKTFDNNELERAGVKLKR